MLKLLSRLLLLATVGAGVLSLVLLRHSGLSLLGLHPRSSVLEDGPAVVQKIRALSRLETVAFNEQKVLEGQKEWPAMPQWLLGDRMLFVAQGEVTAGVDFTRFHPEHLRWDGETVQVRLPHPEVFHVTLDNRASRVYDRSTGWLNKSDPQLESRVRQRADEVLLSSALEEGILERARRNAESDVEKLLKGFGAKTVTFV